MANINFVQNWMQNITIILVNSMLHKIDEIPHPFKEPAV